MTAKFMSRASTLLLATIITICITFVFDVVAILIFNDFRGDVIFDFILHSINVAIGAAVAIALYKQVNKNQG
jgi:hypothetical protein